MKPGSWPARRAVRVMSWTWRRSRDRDFSMNLLEPPNFNTAQIHTDQTKTFSQDHQAISAPKEVSRSGEQSLHACTLPTETLPANFGNPLSQTTDSMSADSNKDRKYQRCHCKLLLNQPNKSKYIPALIFSPVILVKVHGKCL